MDNKEIEAIVREVLSALPETQGCIGKDMPQAEDRDRVNLAPEDSTGGIASQRSGNDMSPEKSTAIQAGVRRTTEEEIGGVISSGGRQIHVTMPLKLALRLIERIEAKAAEWDMRVVTAVSDASARPVAVHCMDGSYIGSFDVALNKTYTSIAFQMSTAQLGQLSQPGESLYGIQFTNGGRIVIFGGGEVLEHNGTIIGALGVSGGSAKQDTELAAYGKSIFKEVIACL